jgi:spore germination cell wall hydrolase CwlJ-like protein
MCLIAGLALTSFANIYTYAAEEDNVVTEETIINNTTADETAAEEVTPAETEIVTVEPTATPEPTPTEAVKEEETAVKEEQKAEEAKEDVKEEVEKAAKTEVKKETTKKTTTKKKAEAKTTETKKTAKEEAKYSEADLRLLSALIYSEANGESYNGKLAVAIVVMNRTRSKSFPDSVKGVIYQKYQFGPVTNGSLNKALAEYDNGKFTSTLEKECIKAAKEALSGTTSITASGKTKEFSKYLFFSGRLRGHTFSLGNHQFK